MAQTGTITLTQNSTAVTGSGTAFTTALAAGGFIVATVGGTAYTLGIKSIESNTALTLNQAYNGPTTGGLVFDYVPMATLNLITSSLAAQVTYALRAANLDRNNWQQIFTGTGNVTVNIPDGTSWNGPAWNSVAAKGANSDITSLSGLTTALSIAQGGTGAKTASAALTALGALAASNGVITGAPTFSSTAVARTTANNMGFTQSGNDRFFIPLASSAIMVICKSVVVTLDSNGDAVVSYPQAFNSFWCPLLGSGDVNTLIGSLAPGTYNNNGFTFRARTSTGGNPAGSTIRLNYIAIGVIN